MKRESPLKIIEPNKRPKKVVAGYVWDFEQMIFNKKSNSFALTRVAQSMAQQMTNDTRKIPCKDNAPEAPRYLVRIYEEYEKRWSIFKKRTKKYFNEEEWNGIAEIAFIVIIAGLNSKYANAMLYMYRQVYQAGSDQLDKIEQSVKDRISKK